MILHRALNFKGTALVGVVETRDEVQLILDHGMELESSTKVVAI